MSRELYRIVDANWNRAKEGLRVVEDITRFVCEDQILTAQLKKMRHQLTKALLSYPVSYAKLLDSRESGKDVGKKSHIQDAGKMTWQNLLIQNLKRTQEALRVLEEVSKIIATSKSAGLFQKVRFETYEFEKKAFRKITSLRRHRS